MSRENEKMSIYRSVGGQNVFDVSLQLYGNIKHVVKLLQDNSDLDLNEEIPIGTVILYTEEPTEFGNFVSRKNINIATNDGVTQSGKAFDESFDNKEFK